MDVDTRVDMDAVQAEMRAAQYRIPNMLRDGLREAAEQEALPRVRAAGPSFAVAIWRAGATNTRAYITTRGKKSLDRAAGLLNYGGTVRGEIVPKRVKGARKRAAREAAGGEFKRAYRGTGPKALSTPYGPRARVSGPRHYRGKHYLERAAVESLPGITNRFRDKALGVFEGLETERSA